MVNWILVPKQVLPGAVAPQVRASTGGEGRMGGGHGSSPILPYGIGRINDVIVHMGNRVAMASNMAVQVKSLLVVAFDVSSN